MLSRIFGRFSQDMGIDLGTANTLVYVKDKGIVINEPSVVAINTRTDEILAIGEMANHMIGKTPAHIVAARPLADGVISDFEIAEKMIKHFIDKIHRETFALMPRPRVVIGIPLEVTEVERKAVEDAVLNAGAREVHLIEEPVAVAIGARLPIQDAMGSMVVDIGGGTTDIAVISLGGVVTAKSIKIAGNEMTEDIINFAREEFNIFLGERTAEEAKIKIGSAVNLPEKLEIAVRGRDVMSGLPREVIMTDEHIREALKRIVRLIIETIKDTIEKTPAELVADIYQRGVLLSGGGAMLRGLPEAISDEIKIPVYAADDPLTAVVRGTGIVVEDLDRLASVLIPGTKSGLSR